MSRARRLTAALALTGALFTSTACASSAGPIDSLERLGRKAAQKVSPHPPHPPRAIRGASDPSYGTTDPGRAFFRPCPPLTPRGRELALRLTEC